MNNFFDTPQVKVSFKYKNGNSLKLLDRLQAFKYAREHDSTLNNAVMIKHMNDAINKRLVLNSQSGEELSTEVNLGTDKVLQIFTKI